ncbi:MAG: hypothetical protein AA908_02375 [Chlorobi bacterium NICIL-2]|nr:MAG: hypothetical protein AA908_02375 [Chlorobi bacterium NICIL-2]
MKPVLSPAQMRDADRTAIDQCGIPAVVLMENAARSAAEILRRRYKLSRDRSVLILCGSGNNGGDGLALARHLHEDASVTVVLCGNIDRMSEETLVNYRTCSQLGIPILQWRGPESARELPAHPTMIVDAVLGVGAHGALRSPVDSLIAWANSQPAARVALDVPSGLDADSGVAFDPCFHADCTITMGALKTGLLIGDGPQMCGTIEVAPIGIPARILHEKATIWLVEAQDAAGTYRLRQPRTTKFDYGRVLVVAGSDAMPGAAALCANAAIAAGAGLVELISPVLHPALFPEVMPYRYEGRWLGRDALPVLTQRIERASVVVIGPGLGAAEETIAIVQQLLALYGGKVPIVLDADGLRAVTSGSTLTRVTLTPHRGELARLLGLGSTEIARTAHTYARSLAEGTGATVVLKDFPIQICDAERTYWLSANNPALASGGTGDVLSGIIAALWAQGYEQFEAAWLGVVLHAEAGRIAAARYGELATRASLVIEALGEISQTLSSR